MNWASFSRSNPAIVSAPIQYLARESIVPRVDDEYVELARDVSEQCIYRSFQSLHHLERTVYCIATPRTM
jgi:hypothetical protein